MFHWINELVGYALVAFGVFEGEGRMLVCTTPFWRFKIMQEKASNPDAMLA